MNTDTAIDLNTKMIAASLEALHFNLVNAAKRSAEAHVNLNLVRDLSLVW